MVNSRQKGATGETVVCATLCKHTGLLFERVPGSGCGKIKGDVYVANRNNAYCIEVKNYADSHLSDKVLTSKTNLITVWWTKLKSQAKACGQAPLLVFKYNRSKTFVGTSTKPAKVNNYLYISALDCYIMLFDEWLDNEEIKWLH